MKSKLKSKSKPNTDRHRNDRNSDNYKHINEVS